MKSFYGVILLEKHVVIIRLYEVTLNAWKLVYSQNIVSEPKALSSILANFFTTKDAQYVTQWKTGARGLPQTLLNNVSASLGIPIDSLTLLREQELVCKGLFTELW
jgi:hypothetical protein